MVALRGLPVQGNSLMIDDRANPRRCQWVHASYRRRRLMVGSKLRKQRDLTPQMRLRHCFKANFCGSVVRSPRIVQPWAVVNAHSDAHGEGEFCVESCRRKP